MYARLLLSRDMLIRPTLCLAALIIHPDDVHMHMPDEMFALSWDGRVPDPCYQNNDTALLIISTDIVSVDDDFMANLTTENSSCS